MLPTKLPIQKSLLLFLVLLLGNSCVDRVQFDVPEVEGTLIVDGYISDQPGPYRVHLFTLSKTTDILNFGHPVTAKNVTLFDDDGNSEEMKNQGDGIYTTDPSGMRGVIGKKYRLRIELGGGTVFESAPEEITPAGSIDSIYYRFETVVPINGSTKRGFSIFMDASPATSQGYGRIKYSGTFSLRTYPKLNASRSNCPGAGDPAPLPCSGFIWTGSILQYVGPCTCCISYITEPESKPHLNDGNLKGLTVGYVDFNEYSFSENKYMLKVEYMSLTRDAYEYWKIFRDQLEGATSLFQPAYGAAKTNIISTNTNVKALGFFYATSIESKVAFLSVNGSTIKVPQYEIQPPENNCYLHSTGEEIYLHSTTIKPPEWDCDTCTHYVAN